MQAWLNCMRNQILRSGIPGLLGLIGLSLFMLFGMAIACIGASAGWVACMIAFLIVLAVFWAVVIVVWFLFAGLGCIVAVASGAAVGVIGPGQNSSALNEASTCEEAQAELENTNSTVTDALVNRDAKSAMVVSLQQQVNVAQMGVAGATAAVAASFFFPLSLPVALATLAVASIYLANRNSALMTAQNELAVAEAQLIQALAEQGAAEVLVGQLCNEKPTVGIISTGEIPGFTDIPLP